MCESDWTDDPAPRSADKNYYGGANVDDIAVPLIIYSGHTDLVRSIVYVPGKRQYFSAGWDKTIRVWYAPNHNSKKQGHGGVDGGGGVATLAAAQSFSAMPEDSEGFVSSYERMNPLVPPASLRNAQGAHMLNLTRGKKGEKTEEDIKKAEAEAERARQMKTSLGRRLSELEAKLDLQARANKNGNAGGAGEGLSKEGGRRRSINATGRTTRPSHAR